LDSFATQSRLPDELVVCDDRSQDGTLDVLRDFARRAPFAVKIVSNREQMGSTRNFEQSIGLCCGDLIALSDQDDVWHPSKLSTIENRFANDPALGLVFTNGDLIDQHGSRLSGDMWSRFRFSHKLQQRLRREPDAYDLLLSRCFITGATIVFRATLREVALPIPGHTPTFIHDRWVASIAASVTRVEALDEKLIAYRLHPAQQMGVGKKPILQEWLTPYNCSSDATALAVMHDRLAGHGTAKPEFMTSLETRRRHLQARSNLPGTLLNRVSGVAKECIHKRYQRYPLGRAYAAKDLLVGTR
jgi:hypothetical protein